MIFVGRDRLSRKPLRSGAISKVRLQDVILLESIIRAYNGPRFGIEDGRKILGVRGRPLLASIVKPKVVLVPAQTAVVAEAAVSAGLDPIKDDETLKDVFREGGERPLPRRPAG